MKIHASMRMRLKKNYTEWKRLDIKGHILYGSIYMKYPEQVKSVDTDQWLLGARAIGNEELLLNGYRVSSGGDENVLEPDRGDGWITL